MTQRVPAKGTHMLCAITEVKASQPPNCPSRDTLQPRFTDKNTATSNHYAYPISQTLLNLEPTTFFFLSPSRNNSVSQTLSRDCRYDSEPKRQNFQPLAASSHNQQTGYEHRPDSRGRHVEPTSQLVSYHSPWQQRRTERAYSVVPDTSND